MNFFEACCKFCGRPVFSLFFQAVKSTKVAGMGWVGTKISQLHEPWEFKTVTSGGNNISCNKELENGTLLESVFSSELLYLYTFFPMKVQRDGSVILKTGKDVLSWCNKQTCNSDGLDAIEFTHILIINTNKAYISYSMHALNSWILTRTSKTAKFYGHVPFQAISFSTSTLCYMLNFKFANYACWMTFWTHLSWWQPTSGKWISTHPWVNTNHISPSLSGSGVDSSLPTVSGLGITAPCLTHGNLHKRSDKTEF